jgi:probable addiction module antidote protein
MSVEFVTNYQRPDVSVSHDEVIVRRLRKNPDFAVEYLKAALEDEDEPRVLLIALRHLAEAQGIAKVAKAAGIERESLYRALSVHGNPGLSTPVAVTKAIGLKLTVEATSGERVLMRRSQRARRTRATLCLRALPIPQL